MRFRFATALFALALPVLAQDAQAVPAENLFYKAYWLEKGERNFAEAMSLYDQFLQQAPEHRLAKQAATFEFDLLTRAGKTKEAEAFAKKHEKLLGSVAVGAPTRQAPEGEGRGRGEGRGEGRGAGGGGDMQARLADLKKQLEEAKAAGDTEKAAQLEQRIKRMEQMAQGGGPGGPGGGQGGRGMRNPLFGNQKLADMSADELAQFKEGLANMEPMLERMRERLTEEQAKAVDENLAALKKALADNKLEDAQKAVDKIRENMPRRRGGGEGGGAGGRGGREGGGGGGREGGGGGGR